MIINEDCFEHIKTMTANSVDHIITDPPYDIGFMNKDWDKKSIVTNPEFWKECLRVLKPGGYVLAFSHSRTSHRQTSAIEDAGFNIRDTIMWLYGSGFPKSHNVGKAVDAKNKTGKSNPKALRQTRMGDDYKPTGQIDYAKGRMFSSDIENDTTQQTINNEWQGWGTALKPAYEPIVMARKPLEGTVADNVLKYGTGAINIDACRIEGEPIQKNIAFKDEQQADGWGTKKCITEVTQIGRFPANVILDEEAGEVLDEQSGIKKASFLRNRTDGARVFGNEGKATNYTSEKISVEEDDKGASRFFYCSKTNKKERGAGNSHPTVKPIALMEYLIKLVSKEGQTILDPFAGSGSTGIACKNLNRKYILIERDSGYAKIIEARMTNEK